MGGSCTGVVRMDIELEEYIALLKSETACRTTLRCIVLCLKGSNSLDAQLAVSWAEETLDETKRPIP